MDSSDEEVRSSLVLYCLICSTARETGSRRFLLVEKHGQFTFPPTKLRQSEDLYRALVRPIEEDLGMPPGSYFPEKELKPIPSSGVSPRYPGLPSRWHLYPVVVSLTEEAQQRLEPLPAGTVWYTLDEILAQATEPNVRAIAEYLIGPGAELLTDIPSSPSMDALASHWAASHGPGARVLRRTQLQRILAAGSRAFNLRVADPYLPYQRQGYSPDSGRIASGSSDGTICFWDGQTGEQLRSFRAHRHAVKSLACSPDGQRLVSGGGEEDRTVRVWDLQTGAELWCFRAQSHGAKQVAYSSGGGWIASCGDEDSPTLQVWDAETREEVRSLSGSSSERFRIACGPEGRMSISGDGLYDSGVRQRHENLVRYLAASRGPDDAWPIRIRPLCLALNRSEAIVEDAVLNKPVGWFPLRKCSPRDVATHPSGQAWAIPFVFEPHILKIEGFAQSPMSGPYPPEAYRFVFYVTGGLRVVGDYLDDGNLRFSAEWLRNALLQEARNLWADNARLVLESWHIRSIGNFAEIVKALSGAGVIGKVFQAAVATDTFREFDGVF